ncbi:40068_t:CDS:2 [Gigaspora margarita]|uniref:40068_t:CDS:1 n=1 Tax=Gigaspora margarita TaxID=4874 RepID=A0ABN7WCW0_GIGMA|nr:40068_t:CDS:2 [Gigaspora margarita]
MTNTDCEKKKCNRYRLWYAEENFIVENMNRIKRKKNKEEKIKQRQSSAYTRDQLVDFLLDFLDSYDDFDKAELCSQMIDIDFAIFLNSFLDRVETINKNECETYIRLHHLPHLQPQSIAISSEIKKYIQQNKLFTVPQIYHNIKTLGLNRYIYVTRQQIYYWCKQLGINEYKMAEDQIELTIQYLLQQTTFKLII